jgi:aminomethyltransferase
MSLTEHDLKKTPLFEKHIAAGARMVPFAGWEMPLQYTGIIDEHMHTRSEAGLFDICHMGEIILKGPHARKALSRLFTRDTDNMDPGECRYGFLLNDEGGIIDDLIVFALSSGDFMLVVNASRLRTDLKWIEKHLPAGAKVEDITFSTAKIDLQGPLSGRIMTSLAGEGPIRGLKRFNHIEVKVHGHDIIISRTGYTGEDGFEMFMPVDICTRIWDDLSAFEAVKPVGLGARDTLRLEMGYSLYGNDIDEEHTPLEAGLERFVSMHKGFIGKEALLRQAQDGPRRLLRGFLCEGRRSARRHYSVTRSGKVSGEVTSGAFSPSLRKGMGLCYVDMYNARYGGEVVLTDGNTEIKAEIKDLPLYSRS